MAEGNIGFGDAIRTIAKTKELEEKANKALQVALKAEKSAIESKRAIWFITAGGGSFSVSGTFIDKKPGEEDPPPDDGGEDEEEEDPEPKKPEEDPTIGMHRPLPGSTDMSGNATPEEAGTPDAKDLIDGAGDDSHDNEGGSYYNKIMVGDPINNSPVALALNGSYDFPRGDWSGPNSPPHYDTFQQGIWWSVTNPRSGSGAVPEIAMDIAIDAYIAEDPSPWPSGNGSVYWDPTTLEGPDISNNYHATWYDHSGGPPNIVTILHHSCTPTEGPIICPSSSPTKENTWPLIGNGILAFIDGLWTPNPYDSEIPPIYAQPQATVKFSMGDNRYGIITPARNGGKIMYETQGINSSLVKDGTFGVLFRSNNTIEKFVESGAIHFHLIKT